MGYALWMKNSLTLRVQIWHCNKGLPYPDQRGWDSDLYPDNPDPQPAQRNVAPKAGRASAERYVRADPLGGGHQRLLLPPRPAHYFICSQLGVTDRPGAPNAFLRPRAWLAGSGLPVGWMGRAEAGDGIVDGGQQRAQKF